MAAPMHRDTAREKVVDTSVVGRWTRGRKSAGSIPGKNGVEFPSELSVFVVAVLARKRLQPLCQRCTWQVTAKYAYIASQG